MSSEMREFGALDVENLRSLREVVAGTEHWAKVVSLDRAIALLARTEAGADGVDTFAEWLATEMPAGTVIGNPAWWANRIARQYRVRSGVTHPQDASAGDAIWRERWIDLKAAHLMLHANEGYEIARADAEFLANKMHAEFLDALQQKGSGNGNR